MLWNVFIPHSAISFNLHFFHQHLNKISKNWFDLYQLQLQIQQPSPFAFYRIRYQRIITIDIICILYGWCPLSLPPLASSVNASFGVITLVFALSCISELCNILIWNCTATHEMHNMIFGNCPPYTHQHIRYVTRRCTFYIIDVFICGILFIVMIRSIIFIVAAVICCWFFAVALLHNQKLQTQQIPAKNYQQHSTVFMQ